MGSGTEKIDYNNRDGKNKNNISLREFVYKFIKPNSLIRVHVPYKNGHKLLFPWEDKRAGEVTMEWEIEKGNVYKEYLNNHVIGVTDILNTKIPEAINIVIDPDCKVE